MGNLTEEDLKNMSPEEIQELQKKNCIFCQIISGKIPAYKIFEDEKVVCILDINPANEGHVLLLPKEHYQIFPQVPHDLLGHMMIVAKKISKMMLATMKLKGTSIYLEIGAAAGQKAPHVMLHIIPSNPEKMILQPETKKISVEDFDKALNMLRAKTGFKVSNPAQPQQEPVKETVKQEQTQVQQKEENKETVKQEQIQVQEKEENKETVKQEQTQVQQKPQQNNIPKDKNVDLDKISKLFG